ncbi:hypothetical protein [Pseudomonas serbica]|uniref:hypothetical protein n=1 Tax=Pseudomonas serbica TaxID=2965074 RepID=UPI00237B2543|nr:hypothetical protein [Pseudomonas serbica]
MEKNLLAKGMHVDLYPLRKAMRWYKESYYQAYWMTQNQDTVNAMDFVQSCAGEPQHYFVDNLFSVARLLGRFEVVTELLKLSDVEFQTFQTTYCRDAEFDFELEKNWLTHLVSVGIEPKGLTDITSSMWAHCVGDVIQRTAGEGRSLAHTASRLMFEVLESFPEDKRDLACESMKLGFAGQWQAGYVNTDLFNWCDYEHYFGMSARDAALKIHEGALCLDWKQRFLLSLLEDTPDQRSVTKDWSSRALEFQIISIAEGLKTGSGKLETTFYDFVEKSFAVIAEDHEISSSLLVNDFSDGTWPRNHRKISNLVGAYHHCMSHLFHIRDDQPSQHQVDVAVATLKEKMATTVGVSRSFFTLGTLLGQNVETMAFFEHLVENYSVNAAFLHELSGLDKSLMCRNLKFAASIFSSEIGL